jgi:hypothetical protein
MIICANAKHSTNKIEYINIKIINKNKHPHNPPINYFVNEYCTITSIFGGCDCFSWILTSSNDLMNFISEFKHK